MPVASGSTRRASGAEPACPPSPRSMALVAWAWEPPARKASYTPRATPMPCDSRAQKPYITLEDTSTGGYSRIQADGGGMNLKTQGAVTGSNSGGQIHLDGTGSVGIGTLSPSHHLSIRVSPADRLGLRTTGAAPSLSTTPLPLVGRQTRAVSASAWGTAAVASTCSAPQVIQEARQVPPPHFVISDIGNVGIGPTCSNSQAPRRNQPGEHGGRLR